VRSDRHLLAEGYPAIYVFEREKRAVTDLTPAPPRAIPALRAQPVDRNDTMAKATKKKAAKAKDETVSSSTIDTGKYEYGRVKYKDKDGKSKISRGVMDAVAIAMLGMGPTELDKVVKKNSLEDKVAKARGGNPGQFRMAVGNSLRAKVRAGEVALIGDHEVKKLDQRVALPEGAERVAA
jgi:hypothetical protein